MNPPLKLTSKGKNWEKALDNDLKKMKQIKTISRVSNN